MLYPAAGRRHRERLLSFPVAAAGGAQRKAFMTNTASNATALNRDCLCSTINPVALEHELADLLGDTGLYDSIRTTQPHLFSATAVFVTPKQVEDMRALIEAVESVVTAKVYRDTVLVTGMATPMHVTPSVFLGYDFHLSERGPRLIEINTNAGGALLNVYLARAQKSCCVEMRGLTTGPVELAALEEQFVAMFRNEWQLAGKESTLTRIAIVDDAPMTQYLYPEFLLFQALFRRHGIEAVIAEPAALSIRNGKLWYSGETIDLVYNRLTDFMLTEPAHAELRNAWEQNLAVVTPHPLAHALYANKRNLILLTDPVWLKTAGIPGTTIDVLLNGIARTRLVEPAQGDTLWTERKRLFFKPAAGFGSKAVYRGDKLTRRVWDEILAGDYVSQELVAPGERHVQVETEAMALKYDVRNFVYAGKVQLLAARLYQGQATNFRTPGGGFAPVFYPPLEETA